MAAASGTVATFRNSVSPSPSSSSSSSQLTHLRSSPSKVVKFTSCSSSSFSVSCAIAKDLSVLMAAGSDPTLWQRPDSFGRFGKFGGKYVPETLMHALSELETAFHSLATDADFQVVVQTQWDCSTSLWMIGVEAAAFGLDSGKHAATLTKGDVGVLHGAMSYVLQDDDGQIIEPHFISAGLDYPGVGPEHSFLKDMERAEYYSVTDEEALEAFKRVSRLEGIIPALETSHARAHLEKLCPTLPDGTRVVLNFSGRGDKDVQTVAKYLEV